MRCCKAVSLSENGLNGWWLHNFFVVVCCSNKSSSSMLRTLHWPTDMHLFIVEHLEAVFVFYLTITFALHYCFFTSALHTIWADFLFFAIQFCAMNAMVCARHHSLDDEKPPNEERRIQRNSSRDIIHSLGLTMLFHWMGRKKVCACETKKKRRRE